MAVIVEVLGSDGRTVRERLRADVLPLTIGRAWSNDLILEDAYVDGNHARLDRGPDGSVFIEDLDSLNGLIVTCIDGTSQRQLRVQAGGGREVRLGRTTLRFRASSDPVPPALREPVESPGSEFQSPGTPVPEVTPAGASGPNTWDSPVAPPPSPSAGADGALERAVASAPEASPASHPASSVSFFARRGWRIGWPLAAGALVATHAWLTTYTRGIANEMFQDVLVFLILATAWSGAWSLASRFVVGRFNFSSHLAVVSAAVFVGLNLVALEEWVLFIFPESRLWPVIDAAAGLFLVAAIVATHMSFSSTRSRTRRWRAGGITAGALLGFGLLALALTDDGFTDVPHFSGVLKPITVHWPAPLDVDAFVGTFDSIRDEVDGMVEAR